MTAITESKLINHCLVSNEPVCKVLDLGQHAYADTFIAPNQLSLSEPVFPLEVYMNADSGMFQLGYISDAQDRYNLYAYSYTSSNSKTSRDHWDEYAATIKSKYNTQGFVLEIGSNDGYLINHFKQKSQYSIGIDPSSAMCKLAEERGVTTINGLFNKESADKILEQYGKAKVIMANNVFNHSNNPLDFAQGVSKLLDKDGVFVFEVPYWSWMVTNGNFPDMIYHEHPTYFTIKGAQSLLSKANLTIVDFDLVNYHGKSLRVFAKLGSQVSDQVTAAVDRETSLGIFDSQFYVKLQNDLERKKVEWLCNFYQILNNDKDAVVIGVGAAAKANTWLNFYGLNKTVISCITDASTFKIGKYTPLSRIPILSDNEFANHPRPYALILSWNIAEPLKQAILKINPNTKFLTQ